MCNQHVKVSRCSLVKKMNNNNNNESYVIMVMTRYNICFSVRFDYEVHLLARIRILKSSHELDRCTVPYKLWHLLAYSRCVPSCATSRMEPEGNRKVRKRKEGMKGPPICIDIYIYPRVCVRSFKCSLSSVKIEMRIILRIEYLFLYNI